MRHDYNKMEYYLGNGFELLSELSTNRLKPFNKNSRHQSSNNPEIFNVMLFTKFHVKTVLGTT